MTAAGALLGQGRHAITVDDSPIAYDMGGRTVVAQSFDRVRFMQHDNMDRRARRQGEIRDIHRARCIRGHQVVEPIDLGARGHPQHVGGEEGRRRTHDFRPVKALPAAKEPKAEWLKAMAEKLTSEEGRALYKLRRQTVEPVFGVIKAVLSFTGFSLRGLDKVAGEWDLVTLAYNCKRLHKLKMAM